MKSKEELDREADEICERLMNEEDVTTRGAGRMTEDKSREIFLRNNEVIDGILSDIREEDGYIGVIVEFKDRVRVEYPIGTPEGAIIRDALGEDMVGSRVLISKVEGGKKALYVAEKREEA